jgi:hypothetical protein
MEKIVKTFPGTCMQCCRAENISFGSDSVESKLRIPAPDVWIFIEDTLKITFFEINKRIKIVGTVPVTVYKNFFSNDDLNSNVFFT